MTRAQMRAPKDRSDGKVTLHEAAIRGLIASHPDMCRNGFPHSIRQLWAELYADLDEDDREEVPALHALPDAYRIDRENSHILIYEVEDTNPISKEKLWSYAYYWFKWDAESDHDWLPRLLLVDRYGNVSIEVDLCSSYFSLLADAAQQEDFPSTPWRMSDIPRLSPPPATPESEIARLGGVA